MKRLEENKGITLIALIITIIVMLILVGVTVSVVLNGGLFSKTRIAAEGTQIEIDRENLQSAVWATIGRDGKIHLENIELPIGFTEDNGKYISLKGNKFRVKEDGMVELIVVRNSTELERYVFGEKGEGISWDEFEEVISDELVDLEAMTLTPSEETEEYYSYIKYDDKIYRFKIVSYGEENLMTDSVEGIKLVYETKGREGETVEFDSDSDGVKEEWKIIYDYGDNVVEMISMDSIGSLVLGKDDPEAQGNTDIEKAIYSYNNAITRLNNYCESLITNPNKISVRSVGSNPENPNSENTKKYESNNLKKWNSAYNGVLKSGDINLEQDLVRMSYHDCARTTSGTTYTMSSRCAFQYGDDEIRFGLWTFRSDSEDLYTDDYLDIERDEVPIPYSQTNVVRPVVKININSI